MAAFKAVTPYIKKHEKLSIEFGPLRLYYVVNIYDRNNTERTISGPCPLLTMM